MGRYRFHKLEDLTKLRGIVYRALLVDDEFGLSLSAATERRKLARIDRELRRRKRHDTATPEDK